MQHLAQPVLDNSTELMTSWAPRSDARRYSRTPGRNAPPAGAIMHRSPAAEAPESAGGPGTADEVTRVHATFPVRNVGDATVAREYARSFARQKGFGCGDEIVIDAALGEMAANVLTFAGQGEFVFGTTASEGRTGIVIVVRDRGPGIPDVSRALTDGYSTAGRPGLGLAGSRRLMDSFQVASTVGEGTTITMKKWLESAG